MTANTKARLTADGACVVRRAVSEDQIAKVALEFAKGRRGSRGVAPTSVAGGLIAPQGALGRLASELAGHAMRPVRVVLFDKTADDNWIVPWHQDRTIAVVERHDSPGFGPWSVKDGVVHVEPPVTLLEGMLTLRLFVDPCDTDQGPVRIALGSHHEGKVVASNAAECASRRPELLATGDAGDVLAMRLLALHASGRSTSKASRRVLHVDYAGDALPEPLRWAMA